MTCGNLDYRARTVTTGDFSGYDPDIPTEGYYRRRLRRGAMFSAIRIWLGAPIDPATGEEVPERGVRWQATVNGEAVPVDTVWPGCARDPIDKAEHDHIINGQAWGRIHDPEGPHANPNRPIDLLRAPLPF